MDILEKIKELITIKDYTDEEILAEIEKEEASQQGSSSLRIYDSEINSARNPIVKRNTKPVSITIATPSSFDDSQCLADLLKAEKPVIVNYEFTPASEAKRIHHFLQGCIAALGGEFVQIDEHSWVYVPTNVLILDRVSKNCD